MLEISETEWASFCDHLSDKIASIYGVSKVVAVAAVDDSFIQKLVREDPLFVGHESMESWAEYVYLEMIA